MTANEDTLRLWDLETDRVVNRLTHGHADEVACLAFSPDGLIVASGGGDGAVPILGCSKGSADR